MDKLLSTSKEEKHSKAQEVVTKQKHKLKRLMTDNTNTNSSQASKPEKPLWHWSSLLSGLKYFGLIAE